MRETAKTICQRISKQANLFNAIKAEQLQHRMMSSQASNPADNLSPIDGIRKSPCNILVTLLESGSAYEY